MPRINRRSEQPFVSPKTPQGYNGAQGFYVFVPVSNFGGATISPTKKRGNPKSVAASARLSSPPPIQHQLSSIETFGQVAEEWFANNSARWVETYRVRLRGRLDEDLLRELSERNIADIQPLDMLKTIRRIEERGAESAKRILHMASSIFRYGVATSRCFRDPAIDIKGALRPPLPAKHRRALPTNEIPEFTARLRAYDGDKTTALALRLLVLTFVRTGELRFARWAEFENLGSREAVWRIPADRMKLRRPHTVPLAKQAVSALEELRCYTG